jgi:uncharacterized OsmC-like protein
MSELRDFLKVKSVKVGIRDAEIAASAIGLQHLKARVVAEGRTGVRQIHIGDHHIIMDSGPDQAGYSLGPGSQPMMLGVLGSCLTHVFLIQAARRNLMLDEVEVVVEAVQEPRAGRPGFEDVPIYPHDITYSVYVASPHSEAEIEELRKVVEATCPLFNLVQAPVVVSGTLVYKKTDP